MLSADEQNLSDARAEYEAEIARLRDIIKEAIVDCEMARDCDIAYLDPLIERLSKEQ